MVPGGAPERDEADRRSLAAEQRDLAAARRDLAADERDRRADERDRRADEREREADARDRRAEEREREVEALIGVSDARIASLVHEVDGLHAAMEHRGVIEPAKGVIMHTMGCGPDAAFAVLVVQSQTENRKLRDIAADIAAAQERLKEASER